MYFSAENLPEVSPVVMNYKMRHNKNQQKNGKTRSGRARLHARVAMEAFGRLAQCV